MHVPSGHDKPSRWQSPFASGHAHSLFEEGLSIASTSEQRPQDSTGRSRTATAPIVEHNARSTGTDVAGYLTESPGFTFVRDGDAVYHAYSTTWRGLEFLMTYNPILDHAPKGRDENEAWQLWIRRHDEYEGE